VNEPPLTFFLKEPRDRERIGLQNTPDDKKHEILYNAGRFAFEYFETLFPLPWTGESLRQLFSPRDDFIFQGTVLFCKSPLPLSTCAFVTESTRPRKEELSGRQVSRIRPGFGPRRSFFFVQPTTRNRGRDRPPATNFFGIKTGQAFTRETGFFLPFWLRDRDIQVMIIR